MITAIDGGGVLYPAEKLEVHRRGLLHLAVSVFVFCGDRLLLQRRAPGKYHSGLLWANACCSHPGWGERVEACARRRLAEELGLQLTLQRTGCLDYRARVGPEMVENERVHFFAGELEQARTDFILAPEEVIDTCWMTVNELRRDVGRHPEAYSSWLRIYLERAPETGIAQLLSRHDEVPTNQPID